MLVLSRKSNQEILINGNIRISVLKIKGNVVRIGIDAPAEVSIKRGELEAKNCASNKPDNSTDSVDGAVVVAEEQAGYQLLPLPSANISTESLDQASTDVPSKFPEIFNRNRFCNVVPPKKHSA